jgi:nitroreductase
MSDISRPVPPERRAQTSQPLHELLAQRWSSRAFHPEAELDDATVTSLLEAVRWAPSASNHQPRRFIAGLRGTPVFDQIASTLRPRNAAWARRSALLVLNIALLADDDGEAYRYAEYDLGQAVAHLTVQAESLGLGVRQMAGFDAAKASEIFELAEPLVPMTVAAVGPRGDIGDLTELGDQGPELADAETLRRVRRPLHELVLRRS